MSHIDHDAWWDRHEIPTVVLALALYGAWLALTWWHAAIPGWALFLLGGYVTQWHFSLQHESIHGMRGLPAWLRHALVWPPIGVWFPYPLYRRSHSTHHLNENLTHPIKDTESYYQLRERWPAYPAWRQRFILANQTLAFRLAFGPLIRLWKLAVKETGRLLAGDFSNVPAWLAHAAGVAAVFAWACGVCGMRAWEYLLCFVYPGMVLGALRTFTEHRYGATPQQRVAVVESNTLVGVLYLYNNLHLVHHRIPTLPWYRIPGYFRRHRAELLEENAQFYYRGYIEITRKFLVRPVFHPAHPLW